MNPNAGAVAGSTTRRRAGVVLTLVCLSALGLGGPAKAAETPPIQRTPAPADDITGQDHPADVFVEAWQYVPAEVHVKRGGHVKFGNYDLWPYGAGIAAHSLEEAMPGCTQPPYKPNGGCDRYPRFTSALTDHGYVHNVEGVDKLGPGRYPFTCQIHSQMHGVLVVE